MFLKSQWKIFINSGKVIEKFQNAYHTGPDINVTTLRFDKSF